MALLRVDFLSDVLELGTSMTVLLPEGATAGAGAAGPPVLYLLHGLGDDDTTWTRYTALERYVQERRLAVVMPQVHRSFYADEALGERFWTFLSTELPAVVSSFFRVSTRRADTFVAGLSMGGYGALKWALRHPDRFAAAASLSGALDLVGRQRDMRDWQPGLMRRVFGEGPIAGDDDLLRLIAEADRAALPRLFMCCGTEDYLYGENLRFRDACAARDIPLTVDFGPGEHEWSYWDEKIQDVLAWLPLPSAR
ncbi:MAG TPA: alpha/beta hydrolase family protein [Pilimelia sp.]|nr:alpha/beta hydrolase family protein [Pilimelia sp.]